MAQRIVAGLALVGLGLGLFGSQAGGETERLVFGAAMLAIWGATGLAVLAGLGWARIVGSLLAVVGIAAGAAVVVMASGGQATLAADIFFTVDGPEFSWSEVLFGAVAFVLLSLVALGVLVTTRRRPTITEAA